MYAKPFLAYALIDKLHSLSIYIDDGCLVYGAMRRRTVKKLGLPCVKIPPRTIKGVGGDIVIDEIVTISLDIDTHHEEGTHLYVVENLAGHELILGKPFLQRWNALMSPKKGKIYLKDSRCLIKSIEKTSARHTNCREITAAAFQANVHRAKKRPDEEREIFAVSMADIQKALEVKKSPIDPLPLLPKYLKHLANTLFSAEKAGKLPPLRGPGIDHAIELLQEDGKDMNAPHGPLYKMTKEELLVLRRTLTELLDKEFIRVSSSPASSPVLFVRKPGGGLRFCVDYRGLNAITRKDRYPLPLIHETLNNIGKAKWFTKVDVSAAFHKLRIRLGDEWKTAFRTRFGLYEWLVTPFGLAGAPSSFQRYINWVLREFLDVFCSAYLDDVLIYTDGSLEEHRAHVRRVMDALDMAGLHLDITKCEFEVKTTKYLGFIIEARKGIRMDPEKVQAIKDWQAPTTTKGIRGFLGFANFYRQFIRDYSTLTRPLNRLTGKDVMFVWTPVEQAAFEVLKKLFIKEPILKHFDEEARTVLEADSSGYATGGVMMQYDEKGLLRPCAFFSKRLTPAECNYEIYDKEMLAIVRCLEFWKTELRSVEKFTIITDHKNLKYFASPRQLSERHARWSLTLSEFNFMIEYRPGKDNVQADALSRKDEDMPQGVEDPRIKNRNFRLLKSEMLANPEDWLENPAIEIMALTILPMENAEVIGLYNSTPDQPDPHTEPTSTEDREVRLPSEPTPAEVGESSQAQTQPALTETPSPRPFQEEDPVDYNNDFDPSLVPWGTDELTPLWTQAWNLERGLDEEGRSHPNAKKGTVVIAKRAVLNQRRTFPKELGLKLSISDCDVSSCGYLRYRKRIWIPEHEPLRTKIIEVAHSSVVSTHPGRNETYTLISRNFYWPGMAADIRRYVRNCDLCGRIKPWKTKLQGLLRPLPVPERKWQDISMDFIDKLPLSQGCTALLAIIDRLGKGCLLFGLPDMEAITVADVFYKGYYKHHGLPKSIVSDRGSQFVGGLWSTFCKMLKINRRLSTAYHPQTDGQTERKNTDIESLVRLYAENFENDWMEKLPSLQLNLNSKTSTTTGIAPFFLDHGYDCSPFSLATEPREGVSITSRSPVQKGEAIVAKIKDAEDWAAQAMAFSQQEQERQANKSRSPAPAYRIGDKVWLNLKNVRRTGRTSKKFDWKHAKYTVTKIVSPHAVQLDVPGYRHPTFHVDLLRPAATDPFPSQAVDDSQPAAIEVDGEQEWSIECIVDEHSLHGKSHYAVKWVGYAETTWEPRKSLEDVEALDIWENLSEEERKEVRERIPTRPYSPPKRRGRPPRSG